MLKNGRQLVEFLEEQLPEEERFIFELDDLLLKFSMMVLNHRLDLGLTQNQLAEQLSVSQAMIAKYESGDFNPSLKTIWEISRKMGMKVQLSFVNDGGEDDSSNVVDADNNMSDEDISEIDDIQPERIYG